METTQRIYESDRGDGSAVNLNESFDHIFGASSGREDERLANEEEKNGVEICGESSATRLWRRVKANATSSSILRTFRTLRDMSGDCYIPPESLEYVRPIGNGGFAEVTLCVYAAPWGEPMHVAVKRLKSTVLGCQRDVEKFIQEGKLWRKLSHPYIVDCLGLGEFHSRKSDSVDGSNRGDEAPEGSQDEITENGTMDAIVAGKWYIVQEYMAAGTLKSIITKQMENCKVQVYTDSNALSWLTQIAKGLAYLHGANPRILHRDLKLENILLKEKENGELVAKIADFGLSALLPPAREFSQGLHPANSGFSDHITQLQKAASVEAAYRLSTATGSLLYMAPEVLSGDAYNEKADVFSFAILMYELLRRSLILAFVSFMGSGRDIEIYAFNVMGGFRPPIPENWPMELQKLLSDCWSPTPRCRPSMEEVCNRLKEIRELPNWDSGDLGLMERSEDGGVDWHCGVKPRKSSGDESGDSSHFIEAEISIGEGEDSKKTTETSSNGSIDMEKVVWSGCMCFQHRDKRVRKTSSGGVCLRKSLSGISLRKSLSGVCLRKSFIKLIKGSFSSEKGTEEREMASMSDRA